MPPISLEPLECALADLLPADIARIARAARKLSDAFTSERAALPAHYLAEHDVLSAYLAAFLLPNAAKVLHCLAEAELLGGISRAAPFEILDLGSGPGTASLAASLFFTRARPSHEVRFVALEQAAAAARVGERLFAAIAPRHHSLEAIVKAIAANRIATTLGSRRFDLIIAANVLNEMPEVDAAFALCAPLLADHLKEDGCLLLVDPALRETTRPLMQLRDRLLAEGLARVAAPCLHQIACPMLAANDRDWCHFYLDWACPQLVARMDALSGMRHAHLKMAYLLLEPPGAPPEGSGDPTCARAVSSPLDSKGKRELIVCAASGELRRLRRLDRDASETNRCFDDVMRGDVVQSGASLKITANDAFSIVRRWNPS
jgi:ribosomal protein RSM22 (predicted rRNA methylase)